MSEKLKERSQVTPIALPSRGLPYEGKVPDGRVSISAITVAEEKMLANKGATAEDKTNVLLHRTCDLGGVTPDDLVLGDRFFLLLKLRSLSIGNRYGFQVKCSECGTQFRHEMDLERDMELKVLADDWREPFEVLLPVRGYTLDCRLLRGKDERAIAKQVSRQHQRLVGEPSNSSYSLLLARHLVAITTPEGREEAREIPALKLVESLVTRDRMALSNAIDAASPGFDPELEITCQGCGYVSSIAFPASDEFFRPRNTG